ncbi:MAG: transglutaminase domain-containing protein [Candidatus Omnitrophica bacterium]|nr:transglutaminase domain-containing protein [Candidatus Omnitrophota bacterium]
MKKTGLIICITLFWAVMMTLLVNEEMIVSSAVETVIRPAPSSEAIAQGFLESWMGVYLDDVKIGYTNTVIQDLTQTEVQGYTVRNISDLKIPILGEEKTVHIEGIAYLSRQKRIKDFFLFFTSGPHTFELKGKAVDGELRVDIKGPEELIGPQTLVLEEDVLLLDFIATPLILNELDIGKKLQFKVFDPMTLSPGYITMKVLGTEKIKYDTKAVDVFVAELDFKGITSQIWVGSDGIVYKEKSPTGFTLVREYREKAVTIDNPLERKVDILEKVSVSSAIAVEDPRNTRFVKVRLSGVNLAEFQLTNERQRFSKEGSRQVLEITARGPSSDGPSGVIGAKNNDPLFEAYLQPELLIQSADAVIIETARSIIEDETDSWKAASLLGHWVYNNIKKIPVVSIPSAVDVLATREGDCNEHTVLFTALARSIGIPTAMCAGVVYLRGRFYYHAWPKVYIGNEWIHLDPTFGQSVADATHIQFAEGNLSRQIDIVRLVGQIKIDILEYR